MKGLSRYEGFVKTWGFCQDIRVVSRYEGFCQDMRVLQNNRKQPENVITAKIQMWDLFWVIFKHCALLRDAQYNFES